MRVHFGEFVLDAGTRQLLKGSADVHLSPKAFDLLCSLVERRPAVVEKADLVAQIWPNAFVVETGLNVLVGEIRRALEDDARQPRYIRTVHGVGYAFSGDAREASEAPGGGRPQPRWLVSRDKSYRLTEGSNIIGRDPGSNVWLDAPSVSRKHARMVIDGESHRAMLEDLGSTNGCYVRGEAVRGPVDVRDGDAVTIGSVDLKACLWNSDVAAETRRIPRKP